MNKHSSVDMNKPSNNQLIKGIDLLRRAGMTETRIAHSIVVRDACLIIGAICQLPALENFVIAALLHDIGRTVSSRADHGARGAELLEAEGYDQTVCQMVRTHVGVGLTIADCERLGVEPVADYEPTTDAERLLCVIDNLFSGDRLITLADSLEKFRRTTGSDEVLHRQRELYEWAGSLIARTMRVSRADLHETLHRCMPLR